MIHPQSTSTIAKKKTVRQVVAVDIGQVLLERGEPGEIPSERIPGLPAVRGALAGFRKLVAAFGRENVWIVSRCAEASEPLLVTWLKDRSLIGSEPNTIPETQVRFCRERADKAKILAEIGANAHIDDRADVLAPTSDVASLSRRILFRPKREDAENPDLVGLPGLIIWSEWSGLPEMLVGELAMVHAS